MRKGYLQVEQWVWEQEPQDDPELLLEVNSPPEENPNTETSFSTSALPHFSQQISTGADERISFSNSLPQARHLYSNIGMFSRLKF